MMNTLANHKFLPHDGRNITKANAVAALKGGLNFNESLAELMWEQAIIANPEPNATFFTLDHLNRHNVLEHDASLSRSDDYFGNNHLFNQSIFDSSRKWWPEEIITAKQLAHSKIYRQLESRSTNPEYRFTESTEEFSLGEVAAPIIVFGDMAAGTVERSKVEYFFRERNTATYSGVWKDANGLTGYERLPIELGWLKKEKEITLTDILSTTAIVRNASQLHTD